MRAPLEHDDPVDPLHPGRIVGARSEPSPVHGGITRDAPADQPMSWPRGDREDRRRDDRPKLRATLKMLKAGDTLVIYKLDRVARSMKELQ